MVDDKSLEDRTGIYLGSVRRYYQNTLVEGAEPLKAEPIIGFDRDGNFLSLTKDGTSFFNRLVSDWRRDYPRTDFPGSEYVKGQMQEGIHYTVVKKENGSKSE